MATKLPKRLFVKLEVPDNLRDDAWFSAADTMEGIMDNDGPDTIGVYELVDTKRVAKVLHVDESKQPKR